MNEKICTSIDELRVGMRVEYTVETAWGIQGPFTGTLGKGEGCAYWYVLEADGSQRSLGFETIAAGRVRILDEAGAELTGWPPRAGVYESTISRLRWETAGDGEARLLPNGADIPITPSEWQTMAMRFVGPSSEGAAQLDTSKPRTPQVGEWYERVGESACIRQGGVYMVTSVEGDVVSFAAPEIAGGEWTASTHDVAGLWRGPVPAPESAREVERVVVQERPRCWDCHAAGPFPLRNVRRMSRVLGLELCDACYLVTEEEAGERQDRADTVHDDKGKPIGRRIDLERPPRPRTVTSMPSGALTGYQGGGWNRRVP